MVTASLPTALKGQYHLDQVPPGTYTVSVTRSGVRPTSSIIEIVAGVDLDYSVELAEAASISGLVRNNGVLVGADYVVQLFRATDYPGVVYATTRTNGSGRYTFGDIDAPEAYVVQVRRTRGGVPLGTRTVQIGPSDTPDDIDVRVSDD